MDYTQTVVVCEEHADCALIVGVLDGKEVSWAHAKTEIPVEERLSADHPEAEDWRGDEPRKIAKAKPKAKAKKGKSDG